MNIKLCWTDFLQEVAGRMKAIEWIDRLKAAKEWESDYRAAKELGIGRATVSKYRSAGTTFDEETAVKVADLLGELPEIILIDQAAERAGSESAKAAFSAALERLRGKAEAVPLPGVRAGGGRGRIDISSVTSPDAAEWSTGPRGDTEYTSYPPPAMSSAALSSEILLQLVARRAAPSSYRPQPATA